jgi:hypothetical protein
MFSSYKRKRCKKAQKLSELGRPDALYMRYNGPDDFSDFLVSLNVPYPKTSHNRNL